MKENKTIKFIQKVNAKFGDLFVYDKTSYTNYRTNVIITCKNHGDFQVTATNLFKETTKYGCPKCAILLRKSKIRSIESFLEEAKTVHGDKYNYSKVKYLGTKVKICIICEKHGEFMQIPDNHLKGHHCSKCGIDVSVSKQKRTLHEFINLANTKHNNKYDYSLVNYKRSRSKIKIICKKHGDFEQMAYSHLQGSGCPKCLLKNQSALYLILKEKFPEEMIIYNAKVKWLGKQHFDIYFPKHNIAVEYNGRQHYIPVSKFGGEVGYWETVERDQLKTILCKANNCELFILKHDYVDNDLTKLISSITNSIIN